MPDYHKFLMRHGEHGVQDLVERLERYEGIKHAVHASLEQRWMIVMLVTAPLLSMAA
jgi:hypothetical protein